MCQRVLEIGVFFGASVRMWRDYFPNAEIHGVDAFLGLQGNGHRFGDFTAFWDAWKRGCAVGAPEFERVRLHQVDQSKRDELERYAASQCRGTFDLVLDDGSHLMRDPQLCLGVLFPLVRPGGYLVIEDLHSSEQEGYDVLPDRSNSTLMMLQHHMRTREFASHATATMYMRAEEVAYLDRWVERIDIHRHGESLTCAVKRRCFPKTSAAPPETKSAPPETKSAPPETKSATPSQRSSPTGGGSQRSSPTGGGSQRSSPTGGGGTRPGSLAFVNFSSTAHHLALQVKHNAWARAFLRPDSIVSYDVADLDLDFRTAHKTILEAPRGGGFWLWKPYLILATLLATDAEYVVYCDVHATTTESANVWKARVATQPVAGYEWPAPEAAYTKRKCIASFGAQLLPNAPELLQTNQVVATIIAIRNTQEARDFVSAWLQHCLIDGVIDDSKRPGETEAREFVDHRHDQSVYSILYKLAGFRSYPKSLGLMEHVLGR